TSSVFESTEYVPGESSSVLRPVASFFTSTWFRPVSANLSTAVSACGGTVVLTTATSSGKPHRLVLVSDVRANAAVAESAAASVTRSVTFTCAHCVYCRLGDDLLRPRHPRPGTAAA